MDELIFHSGKFGNFFVGKHPVVEPQTFDECIVIPRREPVPAVFEGADIQNFQLAVCNGEVLFGFFDKFTVKITADLVAIPTERRFVELSAGELFGAAVKVLSAVGKAELHYGVVDKGVKTHLFSAVGTEYCQRADHTFGFTHGFIKSKLQNHRTFAAHQSFDRYLAGFIAVSHKFFAVDLVESTGKLYGLIIDFD